MYAGVFTHILFRETMLTRNTMMPDNDLADVVIFWSCYS